MVREVILLVNDGSLLLRMMGCLLEARGYYPLPGVGSP